MIEIKMCMGGFVQFGLTGAAATVYKQGNMPCVSAYQDEKYGQHMRVHNKSGKNGGDSRCMVCGHGNGVVRP